MGENLQAKPHSFLYFSPSFHPQSSHSSGWEQHTHTRTCIIISLSLSLYWWLPLVILSLRGRKIALLPVLPCSPLPLSHSTLTQLRPVAGCSDENSRWPFSVRNLSIIRLCSAWTNSNAFVVNFVVCSLPAGTQLHWPTALSRLPFSYPWPVSEPKCVFKALLPLGCLRNLPHILKLF